MFSSVDSLVLIRAISLSDIVPLARLFRTSINVLFFLLSHYFRQFKKLKFHRTFSEKMLNMHDFRHKYIGVSIPVVIDKDPRPSE